MSEMLHVRGSFDRPDAAMSDDGDILPIADVFPDSDETEFYSIDDLISLEDELTDPAEIETPTPATPEDIQAQRIEDLADKLGISYDEARRRL